MKQMKTLSILFLVLCFPSGYAQKIIFLHHSTGGNLYDQGNVPEFIDNYNIQHGTNYQITERNYPDTPYPWDNYPYDYWNLWINNACDPENPKIECLNNLCSNYDVIIFKHCFPGADILADVPSPEINSSDKRLEIYKLQYRALRDLMDTYPQNKFIVWTLAPLHRLYTTEEKALRARTFVDWVKNDWLQEDGKSHPNIFIFDFFGYIAELNPSPLQGKANCIKYEYELSHSDDNSHPNQHANEYVGPLFAEFIINTVGNSTQKKVMTITVTSETGKNTISIPAGNLRLIAEVQPEDATIKSVTWSVQTGTGGASISPDGILTAVSNGTVTAIARANDGSGISDDFPVTITDQDIPSGLDELSNPVSLTFINDGIFINLEEDHTYNTFSIYNMLGKQMAFSRITGNTIIQRTSAFDPGIYVISITSENSIKKIKFVNP